MIFWFRNLIQGKTHTMLGPNPRKVASTPTSSTADSPPKTAITIQTQSTEGGLMVKAMDEIFRHVEQSDNPDSFKVINDIKQLFSFRNIINRCLLMSLLLHGALIIFLWRTRKWKQSTFFEERNAEYLPKNITFSHSLKASC